MEAVVEFSVMQREKIHEIFKFLPKTQCSSLQFSLLCEYLVVINGYIEYLHDVIEKSESFMREGYDGEEVEYLHLEEEVIMDSNEFQKAINEYEDELASRGISFLAH